MQVTVFSKWRDQLLPFMLPESGFTIKYYISAFYGERTIQKPFLKLFFEVQYVYFSLFRASNMLLSILSIVHLFGIEVILIVMRGY